MKVNKQHVFTVRELLLKNGWTPNKEFNEYDSDSYLLSGKTKEGEATICVLDIVLKRVTQYNSIDELKLDDIIEFIENEQKERNE